MTLVECELDLAWCRHCVVAVASFQAEKRMKLDACVCALLGVARKQQICYGRIFVGLWQSLWRQTEPDQILVFLSPDSSAHLWLVLCRKLRWPKPMFSIPIANCRNASIKSSQARISIALLVGIASEFYAATRPDSPPSKSLTCFDVLT